MSLWRKTIPPLLALIAVAPGSLASQAVAPMGARAAAVTPPVTIGTVHGSFWPNPSNSGSVDFSVVTASPPSFTEDFPQLDFNPPSAAQVQCLQATGVNEWTRPFTDVVQHADGSCSTQVAAGNGVAAGTGALFAFQAALQATLTIQQPGSVTFNFYADDGWVFGAGARIGGTDPPRYVSGAMVNAPAATAVAKYPVVGSYNVPSSPAQNQLTLTFTESGTWPIELDYTECCGGQLALTLGTTFSNPIPSANPSSAASRQVMFVHGFGDGWRDIETRRSWTALTGPLDSAGYQWTAFQYYQDVGDYDAASNTCSNRAPDTSTGTLFLDPSAVDPNRCDDAGALAINSALLDDDLRAAAFANGPSTVISNSLGGAITRGWLDLVQQRHADTGQLDSVVFLQGAQQGSWLAAAGESLDRRLPPGIRQRLEDLARSHGLDVHRPAIEDVAPQSPWYDSVNPAAVPHLHYFNFITDMQVQFQLHLLFFTTTSDPVHFGDLVLKPGTDNPADEPPHGGAGFLPFGSAADEHEYVFQYGYLADGIQGAATAFGALTGNPANHLNFGSNLDSLSVPPCNGGARTSVASEIVRILGDPASACA